MLGNEGGFDLSQCIEVPVTYNFLPLSRLNEGEQELHFLISDKFLVCFQNQIPNTSPQAVLLVNFFRFGEHILQAFAKCEFISASEYTKRRREMVTETQVFQGMLGGGRQSF